MSSQVRLLCLATVLSVAALFPVRVTAVDEKPATDSDAKIAFFETKIRPLLVKRCYECHSNNTETEEGGLRLDSRQAIRKGGGRGPAVVPGDAKASWILKAVSHTDPDLKMPPKSRLPDAAIADLRMWIEQGAADPRDEQAVAAAANNAWASRDHWAYQLPELVEQPVVKQESWSKQELDYFILAELEESGLSPSVDAEPEILLRRLYFDLIGLPPSPPDVTRFFKRIRTDSLDAAMEAEADSLLESKHFGERWGRHWLDVARYGESSGGEANISFPYAWRYRDYVIDAVNADIPYDRFLTEQIAGDLLPWDDKAERARLLIATGFLAVGTKNLGEGNEKKFKADMVDEQIDSLSRAILASSVACARCHHHKFDPFTMEDYYGLAGVFASTKTYFGTYTSPANIQSGDPLVLPRIENQKIFHKSLPPKEFDELKAKFAYLDTVRKEINDSQRALLTGKTPKKTFTLREVLANIWGLGPVEGKLETLDDEGNALPLAMGVLDAEVIDVPLLARGEIGREGAIVPRAFPQAIHVEGAAAIPAEQSGRLELALWLTSKQHPLTSRVFVNRIWKHLFGRGLVVTVDNFGTTGAEPSHPELLDTLAVGFTRNGWSLKRLVRTIVLSRSYRQASTFNAETFQNDPENRLLWRMPKRRLEAEAIRDAMLFAAGSLDHTRPGGSLVATMIGDRPISLIGLNKKLPQDLDGSTYRSVYLPVIRDRLPDVLELFDFAEPGLVIGDREITNVPVQALYLMNSEFVQNRAHELAARLQRETKHEKKMVERAFELCFGRRPDDHEMARSLKFLQQKEIATNTKDAGEPKRDITVLSFCQAMLSTAEFRILD